MQFACRADSSSCKTAYFNELDLATNTASFREESSRKSTLPDSDGKESIIASILEHVEREIFLSLETQLTDYSGILIKDGANNAASSVQDGKMHKVRRNKISLSGLFWSHLRKLPPLNLSFLVLFLFVRC